MAVLKIIVATDCYFLGNDNSISTYYDVPVIAPCWTIEFDLM